MAVRAGTGTDSQASSPTGVTGWNLELEETQESGRLRLKLTGELDLASAPTVRQRLDQLRTERRSVLLDLSQLTFMDSSGLHVMIDQLQRQHDGWMLRIDPNLTPQVRRLFELVQLDRLTMDAPGHAD